MTLVGREHWQIRVSDDREASTTRSCKAVGSPGHLYRHERLGRGGRGVPVPYTDTGGQVEETKVDERTPVKELG